MINSGLQHLLLETPLVRCWENPVRQASLSFRLINPSGKHVNVGRWLGGDSKGGPVPSLVPGLDGNVDRRTEIKRVPNVRVPQSLDAGMVSDIRSGQSRKGRPKNVMVVSVTVRSRMSDRRTVPLRGVFDLIAIHVVGPNVLLLVQYGDDGGRGI